MSVHGFNASVNAGWYTFSNLGPLTTTYTPDPKCTASSQMFLGYLNDMPTYGGNVYPEWNIQCTTAVNYYDGCVPTSTKPVTTTPPAFTGTSEEEYEDYISAQIDWRGYDAYYSPGLYCPAGWTTIGLIGRDEGDTTTSSGILSPLVSTTQTENPMTKGYYDYEDPASVVKSVIEPKQTMALCCPSGMKADTGGVCYSFVEDYTPTTGCLRHTGYNYEYGEVTVTRTEDGSTTTKVVTTPTETISKIELDTTSLKPDQDRLTGMFFVPVVTLIYHETDLNGAAATAAAGSNGTESENESEGETPSNAAGRLGASAAGWKGFGSILGIWGCAAVIGAAMVLPW
ncbi:uncharacterized protein BDV14DRAFT_180169 [Aspergillus stella-maris]|uniref:uncharacterized protein n=1 Tax=Aspergillus stella-maris TaxID=1810926 RepID=UPI003CCD1CA2